jgi:signal peptidase I
MTWLVASVVVLAIIVTVVLVRRRSLLITVQGHSMSPTYFSGDKLVVRRRRTAQVGDVVVFDTPETVKGSPPMLVKRVVAVAGDPVPEAVRTTVDDAIVPIGRVVVLGDNAHSLDSRRLGYISTDALRGVVVRHLKKAA